MHVCGASFVGEGEDQITFTALTMIIARTDVISPMAMISLTHTSGYLVGQPQQIDYDKISDLKRKTHNDTKKTKTQTTSPRVSSYHLYLKFILSRYLILI